jgi:rubrerythrin
MINIEKDLMKLYENNNILVSNIYKDCVFDNLVRDLVYTSPIMEGMVSTLFKSKKMMAFNLLQNAIDEAKGAARVRIIAERYANDELRVKMIRHVNDEMNHSKMFADMIPLTGFDIEHDDSEANDIDNVFNFDDDLKQFLCRVHSIEVRSWVMLRHYLTTLDELTDPELLKMKPIIESIMQDEIRHVCYTGETVSNWLDNDNDLKDTFIDCINHTNKETWQDLSNMSNYMCENAQQIIKDIAYE